MPCIASCIFRRQNNFNSAIESVAAVRQVEPDR